MPLGRGMSCALLLVLFLLLPACSSEYEMLVRQLDESNHWETRLEAVEKLGDLGDRRAVEILIPLIKEEYGKSVGFAAIEALGKIGDTRAVGPLVEILGDFYQGGDAKRALAQFDTDVVLAPVIRVLESDRSYQWRDASTVLGEIGDARAIEPLIKMMEVESQRYSEGDALNRNSAANSLRAGGKALVKIDGGKMALLAFSEGLNSDDEKERIAAVARIGFLPSREAREALAEALNDADADVRIAAAIALIDAQEEQAADDLQAILDREDLPVVIHPEIMRYFIGRGIPGSEAVLIKALWNHGGKHTAEAFLNCGNEQLAEAGERWADRHGYMVVPKSGGGTKWGGR